MPRNGGALRYPAVHVFEDDRTLLERLRRGDPQALADAHRKYGRRVYLEALRIVQRHAAAEDIAQESFLRLWNRAGLLDESRGSVGPWLVAIARNCAIDYVRNERRASAPLAECLGILMEVQTVEFEQRQDLKRAIRHLPEHQRRVLELAYYHGLSQRHIAALLHEPLGTVKSWARFGLQRLRKEMEAPAISGPGLF